MAKKKKAHHPRKRTHHRGRIGGVGHFNLMDMLQIGGGLVVGNMAGIMVQKYVTMLPQKLVSLGEMVIGVMHTGHANPIMRGAAYGFAGAGASGFAHETGILRGIDEVMSGVFHGQQGLEDNDGVSGMGNDTQLSGMPNGQTLGEVNEVAPAPQMRYEPMPDAMPMGY